MILVDFETTDLTNHETDPALQPGIVEIGLIELDGNWDITQEHCWLVNPEKPITEGATKTHGLKDSNVVDAPTLPAIFPELHPIFRAHDTWVGFNNDFDQTVLWYQLLRYNLARRFPWPSRSIDIMKVGRDVANIAGKQDVKFPNLTELHTRLFNEGFASAHDGLADCRATARCGKRLFTEGYL